MQELHVVSSVLGRTLPLGESLANVPAAPSSSVDGGTGPGRGSRQEIQPRGPLQGPVGLPSMRVQAVLKASPILLTPLAFRALVRRFQRR